MRASTTQLSLQYLRDLGFTADVCERWVPSPGRSVRKDLFDILDIVALRDDVTLGVQTTTKGEIPKRLRKIQASENFPLLRKAGWEIVVHGWWLYEPPPGGGQGRKHYECVEAFVA